MSFIRSDQFISAAASGKNWRDISKSVLEQLKDGTQKADKFNFGFLYISDLLIDDATSILNLFQSVLNIENWTGCVGIGVCANGTSHIDTPAISVMLGRFDDHEFCMFPSKQNEESSDKDDHALQTWLNDNSPMMVLVHGNPLSESSPVQNITDLRDLTDGFLIGGLSSSRGEHTQIIKKSALETDISGVCFSSNINVATALTQGCTPISDMHTITRAQDRNIQNIDQKKALEAFEDDLRTLTSHKIDQNPDNIILEIDEKTGKEIIPDEYQHLFKGDIHVAFPVSGSDQQDYLVRNITGMDSETGVISVSQNVSSGERLLFVHRSEETIKHDLSHMLTSLRKRIQREHGHFDVKGALYVSCAARAFDENGNKQEGEMRLIQEIIGDVPLTGFYAGGEILNARLYGYTGILTLFL